MPAVLTIAMLTFQEAARRKILLAALALGMLFLTIFGLGYYFMMQDIGSSGGAGLLELNEVRNFLGMAGLYAVNFLTAMMIVLTSVDTLSGEIASGTIHTLVSKPVRRYEIVLGKWLGFAGMVTLYLLFMAGGLMLVIYALSGYRMPNPLQGMSLMWLNALLLLTVSLAGGARLSTLANGVLAFGLFGISFIGGWIEWIGGFLSEVGARQTAVNIGVITSLILPAESLWRRAAYEMQSALVASVGFSPFVPRSVPSLVMIAYAVLYVTVGLLLAVRLFSRRDL
jgi:ABC-type transport system involved in multi-copper enzyme maturation permease subunit